jgi:hypothetical protein
MTLCRADRAHYRQTPTSRRVVRIADDISSARVAGDERRIPHPFPIEGIGVRAAAALAECG